MRNPTFPSTFNKDLYAKQRRAVLALRDGGRCDGLPEGRGHPVAERIEFGPFRLDTGKRVLWRGRELVSVPPKALDLLVALVEQRGDVVSKQDLLSRVWPDTFVEEANLSVNASILRKVLGTQEDGRAVPRERPAPRLPLRGGGAGAGGGRVRPPSPCCRSASWGAAADDDYLGLGMADALIARLGRGGHVVVRPTRAILKYADLAADPIVAGRELSVDAVLDGTVQRDGARLRVSTQLLPVGRALSSWSATFETTFTSLFAVQDAVAEQVARALALTLDAPDAARAGPAARPPATEAYQAYLKGRYFWNRLTREGVAKAFEYFEEAKARDQAYAQPWSGLADAYAVLGFTGFVTPKDAWPMAIEAAEGALARDPELPEARVTLGLVRLFQDWDWRAAEDELERALALDPHSAAAHQWYALFLMMRGRAEEGRRHLARASDIDPLSVIVATMRGFERDLARDYAGSEREYRKALELDPHHFLGHWGMGMALQHLGRFAEAVDAHQQASAALEHAPFVRAVTARSLALAGRVAEARAVLQSLEDPEGAYVSPYQLATVHEALGDRQAALGLPGGGDRPA